MLKTPRHYLQEAIQLVGTQQKLAKVLSTPTYTVSQQNINYWLTKSAKIPAYIAKRIEVITGGKIKKEWLAPAEKSIWDE